MQTTAPAPGKHKNLCSWRGLRDNDVRPALLEHRDHLVELEPIVPVSNPGLHVDPAESTAQPIEHLTHVVRTDSASVAARRAAIDPLYRDTRLEASAPRWVEQDVDVRVAMVLDELERAL